MISITPTHRSAYVRTAGEFATLFAAQAGLPPSAEPFIKAIAESCNNRFSIDHGMSHWLTVLRNGFTLLSTTPQLHRSPLFRHTLILFALFHDVRREHDGECREHGMAGGMAMRNAYLISHDVQEWIDTFEVAPQLAAYACDIHTICGDPASSPLLRPGRSPSPTCDVLDENEALILGLCLDADRLDLSRVSILPSARYLTTPAAKEWANSPNNDSPY